MVFLRLRMTIADYGRLAATLGEKKKLRKVLAGKKQAL